MVLLALALLGVYGYLIYRGKKIYQSKRSIAVLIVTTILALILLGIWTSGQISASINTCGVCGGSGRFLSKQCAGCQGTGYAIENGYDLWWCFWVALAVLGVGLLVALPSGPKAKQLIGTEIEFVGQILEIDRSRQHLIVTPESDVPWIINAGHGNAVCYLSDISHWVFLAQKKRFDRVTIKGTILSKNQITTTNPHSSYNVKVTEISNKKL